MSGGSDDFKIWSQRGLPPIIGSDDRDMMIIGRVSMRKEGNLIVDVPDNTIFYFEICSNDNINKVIFFDRPSLELMWRQIYVYLETHPENADNPEK